MKQRERKPVGERPRSFARGLIIALPLAVLVWALVITMLSL